jgi:peptidoglycan hydrolase-like protein with peptidoglycan-binding domain
MIKKRIAKFAGIAAGAALVFGAFVPMAGAQTTAELQAQIAQLMAQLAAMSGSPMGPAVQFNTNLTVGSRGADVTALQQFLVSKGFLQMPAGTAYGYFGSVTKAAVARWQAASGISPAAGYFGPISRAAISAQMAVTPPPVSPGTPPPAPPGAPIGTPGQEGTLTASLSSEGSGAELNEGDEKQVVMGVELEADESDIRIERIQVNFDSTLDENFYRDLADTIYVMDGSTVLGSRALNSSTVSESSNGDNFITISGLNFLVREGEEEVLTIALDALSNIDTADEQTGVDLTIPVDGIRGVDGAGINVYAPDALLTESFDVEGTTAGDLNLTEGDSNPDTNETVFVDEDDDTDDVLMLSFDLEADNQDITVDAIPVGFTSSSTSGTVAAAAAGQIDGIMSRAILKMDGEVVDTVSIPTTAVNFYLAVFDDLDLDIEDGETVEFEVYVDLNDADVSTFATGTNMIATTTASNTNWDVEDEEGDPVTVDGGTVTSGTMTFSTAGVTVAPKTTSATAYPNDTAANSYGTYTITFNVTAFEDDIYIRNAAASTTPTVGAAVGIYYDIEGTTWTAGTESVIVSSTADLSGNYFVVDEGETEEFTLTVTLNPATAGTYSVELDAIGHARTAVASTNITTVDQNDQRFETNAVYIPS